MNVRAFSSKEKFFLDKLVQSGKISITHLTGAVRFICALSSSDSCDTLYIVSHDLDFPPNTGLFLCLQLAVRGKLNIIARFFVGITGFFRHVTQCILCHMGRQAWLICIGWQQYSRTERYVVVKYSPGYVRQKSNNIRRGCRLCAAREQLDAD